MREENREVEKTREKTAIAGTARGEGWGKTRHTTLNYRKHLVSGETAVHVP